MSNAEKFNIRPLTLSEIATVKTLAELGSTGHTAKFPSPPITGTFSSTLRNNFPEHFFVATNARIYISENICLVITEDNRFFPQSFPKSWPYEALASKDEVGLSVPTKDLKISHLPGTWVSPFTMTDNPHLYHSLMDNYGRLVWLDGLDPAINVARPIAAAMTPVATSIHHAFMSHRNSRDLSPGLYHVDRVIIPPPGNREDRLFHNVVQFVQETLVKKFNIGKYKHKSRLDISRADTALRNLSNEQELISALRKKGFIALCPGNFSLQAQLELFASAEMIVGVHGMGLMPMIVASDCKRVIEYEALLWPGTAFSGLAAIMGMQYHGLGCELIVDERNNGAHWIGKADIEQTLALLES